MAAVNVPQGPLPGRRSDQCASSRSCRRTTVSAPTLLRSAATCGPHSLSSAAACRPPAGPPASSCHALKHSRLVASPLVNTCPIGSVVVHDLSEYVVPYQEAWDFQKAQSSEYALAQAEGRQVDRVLLLQHPPVYTLGTGSTEDHLKFDIANPQLPIYRTERGGEVTYHGPGQLVMYPILNLRNHKQDLHWYLRMLEEVVIRALQEVSGLEGERIDGLTGVWVDGHKVAAIGVRATRWITYHGLALNVVNDLAPFSDIVPCGISNRPVGSVMSVLSSDDELEWSEDQKDALLREYSYALLDSLQDVFELDLVPWAPDGL